MTSDTELFFILFFHIIIGHLDIFCDVIHVIF